MLLAQSRPFETAIQSMNLESTRPTLLSRVRDTADHAAWADFDAVYRDLIVRYCLRQGLPAADAEDVRQLVMMRLIRVLPGFRYDPLHGRFHDYLYRVTHSALTDFQRSPNSRAALVLEEDDIERIAAQAANRNDASDPAWEQEWRDHHLRRALNDVRSTSDARSVEVFERLLAGATVDLAATEFGMTTDAVHKVKQRIRDRVQTRIAEQIRDEDAPNEP